MDDESREKKFIKNFVTKVKEWWKRKTRKLGKFCMPAFLLSIADAVPTARPDAAQRAENEAGP